MAEEQIKSDEQAPEAEISADKGKSPSKWPLAISISGSVLIPAIVFTIVLTIVFSLMSLGEPTKNTTGSAGQTTCKSWGSAPTGAQDIIEAGANKFSIQPALLAAIFLQENGGDWRSARWAGTEPWPVSPAPALAAGPFQFVPGTWQGIIGKSEVKNKCGSLTSDDVDVPEKAACVAAYYIADKLTNAGISSNTMTVEEQDIEDVAVAYTASYDYFDTWRKSGRDPSTLNSHYLTYHTNVWKYFQNFNQGCTSTTAYAFDGIAGVLKVPSLHQCGNPWSNDTPSGRSKTYCGAGCDLTSLAMVYQYFGGTDVTPPDVWASFHGLSNSNPGSYTVKGTTIKVSKIVATTNGQPFPIDFIKSNIAAGHPIIWRMINYKGAHASGHNMVIVGISPDGKTLYLNDPFPPGTGKTGGNDKASYTYPTDSSQYGNFGDYQFRFWAIEKG